MLSSINGSKVRKNEIVSIAEKLFLSKGYTKTTISEIIQHADIAKGTFYYYFPSKIELLDALIQRQVDSVLAAVKSITADSTRTAFDKFQLLFSDMQKWGEDNIEIVMLTFKVFYKDENVLYRKRLIQRNLDIIAPEYTSIIQQGQREGIFTIDNAEETAEILIIIIAAFKERAAELLIDIYENPDDQQKKDIFKSRLVSFEKALSTILGMNGLYLQIYNTKYVDMLINSRDSYYK